MFILSKQNKLEDTLVIERRNISLEEYCHGESVVSDKTFNKINDLSFNDVLYYRCAFSNINFNNIDFCNCSFIECYFDISVFSFCNTNNMSLSFMSCRFTNVDFNSCTFMNSFFCDNQFRTVNFISTNLWSSNFDRNAFFRTKFIDNCNLMNVFFNKFISWCDIHFINESGYTKLNNQTKLGEFCFGDKLYDDDFEDIIVQNKYNDIANSYRNFSKQFKTNDLRNKEQKLLYSAYEYDSMNTKGMRKFLFFIAKISCGYGELWERSIVFSLILIGIFSILYMFLGIEITNTNLLINDFKNTSTYIINYNLFSAPTSLYILFRDFIVCFYYSMMTFTTVGYGNVNTVNLFGMIISTIEMFTGAVMLSIMVGTILRNATR